MKDARIKSIFGESCWGLVGEADGGGNVSAISNQLRGSLRDTEKLSCVLWSVREYLKSLKEEIVSSWLVWSHGVESGWP